MTKKDYEKIASAVASAENSLLYASVNTGETKRTIGTVVNYLSMTLKNDNDRFNPVLFKKAVNSR